jgi:D-ribose pyranase
VRLPDQEAENLSGFGLLAIGDEWNLRAVVDGEAFSDLMRRADDVLRLVHAELFVERVLLAAEMAEFNPPLDTFVRGEFAEAEIDPQPHTEMLGTIAGQAKTIVRTGAFDPWGNIGLVCGVDVGAYFSREGVTVPESYRARYDPALAAGN